MESGQHYLAWQESHVGGGKVPHGPGNVPRVLDGTSEVHFGVIGTAQGELATVQGHRLRAGDVDPEGFAPNGREQPRRPRLQGIGHQKRVTHCQGHFAVSE